MISREKAIEILHQNMQNQNLRRHCYAVAAVMKSLAKFFKEDENLWEITGLVHDLDYEKNPDRHPLGAVELLEKENYPAEIIKAVKSHGWQYREGLPEPQTKMEWSLYCCDELTGFIVACALVRPEKKLSLVKVDSVLKKMKDKAFAAAVKREQIALCQEKLGIPLEEFVKIALEAMQGISGELGL
jgi:putative nucleotidyltransferase with HDIG domain